MFQTLYLALCTIISGEGDTAVTDKLHYKGNNVPVRQYAQKLAGEATVPHSVIGSCKVYKYSTSVLFCREAILNSLSQESNLVRS